MGDRIGRRIGSGVKSGCACSELEGVGEDAHLDAACAFFASMIAFCRCPSSSFFSLPFRSLFGYLY